MAVYLRDFTFSLGRKPFTTQDPVLHGPRKISLYVNKPVPHTNEKVVNYFRKTNILESLLRGHLLSTFFPSFLIPLPLTPSSRLAPKSISDLSSRSTFGRRRSTLGPHNFQSRSDYSFLLKISVIISESSVFSCGRTTNRKYQKNRKLPCLTRHYLLEHIFRTGFHNS